MGNCGGNNAGGAPDMLKADTIVINGDYFNADTRALVAICKKSGIKMEFLKVSVLDKENEQDWYKEKNPTKRVPMVEFGKKQIIGEGFVLFDFVLNQFDKARTIFHSEPQEREIAGMTRWFFKDMRANTSQLIARLGIMVIKPDKQRPKDWETKLRLNIAEFRDHLLKKLDERVGKTQAYLTGADMTAIDVITYCEIKQVLDMYTGLEIPPIYASLMTWYENMGAMEELKEVDMLLKSILDSHTQLKDTAPTV